MTTWRYVVSRQRFDTQFGPEDVYELRELYERRSGDFAWTEEAIAPLGDTFNELGLDLIHMAEAFARDEILDLTLNPPALIHRADL